MSEDKATNLLADCLVGCSISTIKSGVTYTEIELLSEKDSYLFFCSDILLPDSAVWESFLEKAPVNPLRPYDQEILLSAICLYSVLGAHTVSAVEARSNGDLLFAFSNQMKLIFKGEAGPVDLVWELKSSQRQIVHCEFGSIYAFFD